MGTKQVHQLWDRCDGLDVTSTETLVLFALASAQSDVTGCCHPLQEKLAAKTHLSPSCVKEALASLKAKGLVSWRVKPAHVNEYTLTFLPAATGGGADERVGNGNPAPEPECDAQEPVREAATGGGAEERVGNGKRELPAPEASDEVKDLRLRLSRFERVWKRAAFLLGLMFARLIPDPGKRGTSMIDYQILIGKRAFLSCNSLFFRLKREIKDGKHDGEDIAKLILSQLGKLPPTDDPSEPEHPQEESSLATQSDRPDSLRFA